MSRFIKCLHGGGIPCKNHGGSGSLMHKGGYTHPYPRLQELGEPLCAPSHTETLVSKSLDLGVFLDSDYSYDCLSLELNKSLDVDFLIKKSIYNFDVGTTEGIKALLGVLPILDADILKIVYQEVWPGYPTDEEFDVPLARKELRGYLQDILDEEIPDA